MKLTEKEVKRLVRMKFFPHSVHILIFRHKLISLCEILDLALPNQLGEKGLIARSTVISVRRVNQVWRKHEDAENIPVIEKTWEDLPSMSERENKIAREVKKYKLGAYERACTFYRPSLLGRKKT